MALIKDIEPGTYESTATRVDRTLSGPGQWSQAVRYDVDGRESLKIACHEFPRALDMRVF